jgi:hypothetical protein
VPVATVSWFDSGQAFKHESHSFMPEMNLDQGGMGWEDSDHIPVGPKTLLGNDFPLSPCRILSLFEVGYLQNQL